MTSIKTPAAMCSRIVLANQSSRYTMGAIGGLVYSPFATFLKITLPLDNCLSTASILAKSGRGNAADSFLKASLDAHFPTSMSLCSSIFALLMTSVIILSISSAIWPIHFPRA